MTKIDRIGLPSDLKRRNFLIGSSAAGLAFGYVAVSGLHGISDALAAGNFAPTAWYSIAPDGKITVMVGKAEMGQHVSSAMAQIVAEELEADWRMMNIQLVDNDPKFNDPVLGALITGGSWSVRMNFDAMSRAGAAGRITLIDAGAAMMGVPAGECRASNSQVIHSKTGKKVSYAKIVADGKASRVWTADELKAIKLKTPGQYTLVGQSVPQLDIPPKTNGTAKYGIDAMVPGMLYGKPVVPPVRYGATVKAVDEIGCEEGEGLRQGGHPRRQDRHDVGLGGGGGHDLSRGEAGGRGAQDHLRQWPLRQGLRPDPDRRGQAAAAGRGFGSALRQEGRFGRGDRRRGQDAGGGVSHLHQHPRAARADERDGLRKGRRVAHPHRQPVRLAHRRHRRRCAGRRSQERGAAPVLHRRRLRPASRWRHGGAGGARLEGRRQAGEGDLCARRRHGDGFHPAAHLPEGEGRRGRRRQAGRAGARRRLRLADRALGHPGVPDARRSTRRDRSTASR